MEPKTTTEKFSVTASRGLILKVLAILIGAGGVAGGYKALAQNPMDKPSAVLDRMDTRLDRMQQEIDGLKVDTAILKALTQREVK